jgi:P-type Ca2+ transporter type 2C
MTRPRRPSSTSPPAASYWAALDTEHALQGLSTTANGLSQREAAARLLRHGLNQPPRPERRRPALRFAANFVHFFALLLWAAALLAVFAQLPELAIAIVLVIVVNGLFSYWQEHQAERAVEALAALLPATARVRREGVERAIPAEHVVPGDILLLSEGELVAADARLIAAERLRVDLSSLSGESRPMPRSSGKVSVSEQVPAALSNLVFAGTTVSSGRGEAIAFATGATTEFGRIAHLTHLEREQPSPLERELRHVTRFVTVLAVLMGALFYLLGTVWGGLTPLLGFVFALGIIVANVPEGMLPTLTLSLALAVRRMAAHKALVKRLSAVEALGATTLILTDKTGTLTENQMTVREIWTPEGGYRVSGVALEVRGAIESATAGAPNEVLTELLRTAGLCCDARITPNADGSHWKVLGDPTEVSVLVAAAKAGLGPSELGQLPRLEELPFDSERKRMTTIHRVRASTIACVKGAPAETLRVCAMLQASGGPVAIDGPTRDRLEAAHEDLARRGLRVLAVAHREIPAYVRQPEGANVEEIERDLVLLGFIAMEDPPRPQVPAAIAACRRAGVRVLMVTGDSGLTATAVAKQIGMHDDDPRVVAGALLDRLPDAGLDAILDDRNLIFARVSPEHKLRLVEAYQRRGEVVAVTGDGVNDAPALKRADIGVAMGETGTDVAREAADIVLADDDFANIALAMREGRAVYDNVRKFVSYIFASNVPEAVPFIAFALLGVPLPLTVMQILAVDLGTDLLPALALGAERPEPDVMERPPRRRSQRLLDSPTLLRAYGWLGALEAALAMSGYFLAQWWEGWRFGKPLIDGGLGYATATSMTFAGIVFCQIGNVFACRSASHSVFRPRTGHNRLLYAGVACELVLLALVLYVPPLARVFGLAPLSVKHWLVLCVFPLVIVIFEEARKLLANRARLALESSHRAALAQS